MVTWGFADFRLALFKRYGLPPMASDLILTRS